MNADEHVRLGLERAEGEDWPGAVAAYDEAVSDYTRAIDLDPRNASAYLDRAIARGRGAEAVRDYERALEVAPADWPHRDTAQAALDRLRV